MQPNRPEIAYSGLRASRLWSIHAVLSAMVLRAKHSSLWPLSHAIRGRNRSAQFKETLE